MSTSPLPVARLTVYTPAVPDAERAGRLTGPVQDPFDRMLIGQALSYELALVSNEKAFDWYGIRRLW